MTAACSIPVQDTAKHWLVALPRVVCFIITWRKVPMWHLLPKNGLFWRLLPCGACRVIPGSLLPAQEGGKLPAIAARHKIIHREECGWASMLWFVTCPFGVGAFCRSKCWEVLISLVLFEISTVREKVVLRVVVFSKEFCVCQVVCNLPSLQGKVNAVAKAPSGWTIFHQGPGLWLVEFLFLLKWGNVLYEMLCPFTTVTVFLLRLEWQENLFAFDNINVLSSS